MPEKAVGAQPNRDRASHDGSIVVFIFALTFAALTTLAAMALDTMIKLADAFLNVLSADVGWRVLIAAVTGQLGYFALR